VAPQPPAVNNTVEAAPVGTQMTAEELNNLLA